MRFGSILLRLTHLTFNSASTVKRRRKEMKFRGSNSTMKTIDPYEAEQLVLKAIDKDPARRSGVQNIHQRVAFESGVHLSRFVVFLRYFSKSYTLLFF